MMFVFRKIVLLFLTKVFRVVRHHSLAISQPAEVNLNNRLLVEEFGAEYYGAHGRRTSLVSRRWQVTGMCV